MEDITLCNYLIVVDMQNDFVTGTRIVCDASCCAGTTEEKHKAALDVMESCLVDMVNR